MVRKPDESIHQFQEVIAAFDEPNEALLKELENSKWLFCN